MREPRPGVPWSLGRIHRRAFYCAYLDSPAWRARRRAWHSQWVRRYQAEPVCLACGTDWSLQHGDLHHASYDRLGHEAFTDLIPLCRADHDRLHTIYDTTHGWRLLGRRTATIGIVDVLRRQHAATTESART